MHCTPCVPTLCGKDPGRRRHHTACAPTGLGATVRKDGHCHLQAQWDMWCVCSVGEAFEAYKSKHSTVSTQTLGLPSTLIKRPCLARELACRPASTMLGCKSCLMNANMTRQLLSSAAYLTRTVTQMTVEVLLPPPPSLHTPSHDLPYTLPQPPLLPTLPAL